MNKAQKHKRIAKINAQAYTIHHENWGLTVHFSKKKKNGKRTVTTVLS